MRSDVILIRARTVPTAEDHSGAKGDEELELLLLLLLFDGSSGARGSRLECTEFAGTNVSSSMRRFVARVRSGEREGEVWKRAEARLCLNAPRDFVHCCGSAVLPVVFSFYLLVGSVSFPRLFGFRQVPA